MSTEKLERRILRDFRTLLVELNQVEEGELGLDHQKIDQARVERLDEQAETIRAWLCANGPNFTHHPDYQEWFDSIRERPDGEKNDPVLVNRYLSQVHWWNDKSFEAIAEERQFPELSAVRNLFRLHLYRDYEYGVGVAESFGITFGHNEDYQIDIDYRRDLRGFGPYREYRSGDLFGLGEENIWLPLEEMTGLQYRLTISHLDLFRQQVILPREQRRGRQRLKNSADPTT